nr:reverse transcriptase domain-containing protein [Tanacetum cinerariifolium]
MHTRSSSNPFGKSSPNTTTSNPKCHNRRHSKQPFILEESPVDMIDDQRTMTELLRAPTEGYVEEIVIPPILAEHLELKHSLINMMTSDQFFGLEKDNPHEHISGGNLLERHTHDVLPIIEKKSKVHNSRNKSIVSQVKSSDAFVKAVEEIYVTCGGAHPYYQCLTADGNTFPEFRDNIQGYVSAATVN